MLKNSASLEIMLAHGGLKGMDGPGHKEIGLAQLSERQMKGFLVPMHILIIEIRILVKPKAEAERAPAPGFADYQLAGLEFRLPWLPQIATSPDEQRFGISPAAVVGPENRSP